MVIKGKGDYKMSLQSPSEKQENQKSNKFTDFANKTKSKWGTLSKNQKIITSVVAAVVVIIAGAVIYQGISGNSITSVVSGSNLDVEVNSAEVIIPYDNDDSSTYVAYNITLENKGNKTINFADIQLIGDDGESIASEYIYDTSEKFTVLNVLSSGIRKGKKRTGYLVYKVDPDESKDYSLEVEYYAQDDNYENETQETSVSLEKVDVTDNRDKIIKLVESYVNQVFLASKSTTISSSSAVTFNPTTDQPQVTTLAKKSDKKSDELTLGNDIDKDKNSYIERFETKVSALFDYYTPSDSEFDFFVKQYMVANAIRAQISVKVKELYPTTAKVTVSSKVIDISNIDTYDLVRSYLEEATGKSYSSDEAIMQDAEKYIFDGLPNYFGTTSLTTNTSEDDISLALEDDKWSVDSSDSEKNYGYDSLQRSMAGDFFY